LSIDLRPGVAEITSHGNDGLMQRVRIGITGLAVVFLIVLLAAAIVGFRSKEKIGDTNASAAAGDNSQAPPSDPLAELGVAPGGTSADSASQNAEPKP